MGKGATRKGHVLLLVLFGFISLLPVIAIVLDAIRAGSSSTATALLPSGFARYFFRVTAQTLFLCVVTVLISLLIGLPSAHFLARIPSSHALFFTIMLSVPLASPSLVSAVMIRNLFEKSSWLVKTLGSMGIRLPSVYGFFGLLLALLLHTIPYTILILRSGFLLIPRTLSETAFSLGAERRSAFRSVLVPYIMPQVYTAILMMIVYIMGDLGAPLILGGGYKVFASEIYTNFISNWGDKRIPLVFALWSIVVFSLVLLVLVQLQRLTAERTSRGDQSSREDHSTAHASAYVMQWILNIALLIPFLTALGKYLPLVRMNPRESIHDFSPVRNTFLLVLLSVPLMITGALAIAHILKTKRNKSLYTAVILAPAVVPGVILGFGLLKVLYAIPSLQNRTPWLVGILVLAMALRGLPYILIVMQSVINSSTIPQEDSAKALGAGPLVAFLSVTLPQARPVFGIAAVVGLFMCVTELSASLMIYPPGWQTMSIYIAYYLEEGLAARSILMAFLLLLLVETTLAAAALLSRKYKDAFRRNIFFGAEQSAFLSPFTAALPSAESKGIPARKTGFLITARGAIMKVLHHTPFSRAPFFAHPRRNRDREIQALLAENEALRRRVVIAEQKSLRMQINPHFFFNTLNTIVSLITRDPQAAAATIGKLSALFRYTLDAAEEPAILLAKELEYIRTYLEIEKLRFGERLSFSIDVPSELYHVVIPPMLIQPLLENAIKYGKDEKGHSYVHISGHKESGWLTLSVADYGVFKGDIDTLTKAPGTGIRNVMQRLEYSRAGKLRFLRNKPQGVIAQLRINLDQ